ncbi:MAG: MazG nucleotide pyrophosphohydrolase domain-containing protein [Desulfofustis sp.]|jgi:tetrapyrrole methylase family protein / MazG family protein
MPNTNSSFQALIETIQQLRSDRGCPWDRKQTIQSLKKYLVEEFGEIIDAIDHNDPENLCEELGDFLYLILMIGEISTDEELFSTEQIIRTINDKLVRRHPHVFATKKDLDDTELRRQWKEIKNAEKTCRNKT